MALTANVECKFKAKHFIPNHPECGKMHRHTWTLQVAVARKPGYGRLDNGMVVDFKVLRQCLEGMPIVPRSGILNDAIPIPTCEHLLQDHILPMLRGGDKRYCYGWYESRKFLPEEVEVVRAQLWENEKYYCEWTK